MTPETTDIKELKNEIKRLGNIIIRQTYERKNEINRLISEMIKLKIKNNIELSESEKLFICEKLGEQNE